MALVRSRQPIIPCPRGYNKLLNKCLPQNYTRQHQAQELVMRNVISAGSTINESLLKRDTFLLYSDKHILGHVLAYMRRLEITNLDDFGFLALMSLAIDMLEDFSSEIFHIMARTYVLYNLRDTDSSFLKWNFLENYLRKLKMDFLQRMDYNAHVSEEEYKQCELVVENLFMDRERIPPCHHNPEWNRHYMPIQAQEDKLQNLLHRLLVQMDCTELTIPHRNDPFFFTEQEGDYYPYQGYHVQLSLSQTRADAFNFTSERKFSSDNAFERSLQQPRRLLQPRAC